MTTITERLDEFTEALSLEMGIQATRDPAFVIAPCLFVDLPRLVNSTLDGVIMEVPVWLMAEGPADMISAEWLLGHVEKLVELCGTLDAEPITYKDTVPAYRVTATLKA